MLSHTGFQHKAAALLISHGAQVDAPSDDGMTPLMLAAMLEDDEGMVQLLCTAGANLHATDDSHETVLMKAAANPRSKSISKLITKGCSVNAQDISGQTALHHCLLCDPEREEALHAHVSILLQSGADPNIQDVEGVNALHLAVQSSSVNMATLKLIADKIIDVNTTDEDGGTALLHALDNPEVENDAVVELLLSRQADVNVR